ncbi:MAG: DUF2312 domain-containing protein [Oscillospiraceae bacterium]|nr:DUF2312 domain-containing protein [Oscillospiraceae bacterium]
MEIQILNKILSKLDNLEEGQKELQTDMKTVKADVKELQKDMKTVKADVKMLKQGQTKMQKAIKNLHMYVDGAFEDISRLDKRTESLIKPIKFSNSTT